MNPLEPQSLDQWREEREAEQAARVAQEAAFEASDAALDAMANGASGAEAYYGTVYQHWLAQQMRNTQPGWRQSDLGQLQLRELKP